MWVLRCIWLLYLQAGLWKNVERKITALWFSYPWHKATHAPSPIIKQIITVFQQKYSLLPLYQLRNNWNNAEAKSGFWASRSHTTAFCLKDKATVIKSNFCRQSYWNKSLRLMFCWMRVYLYLSGRLNILWWMHTLKCSVSSFSLIPREKSCF